MSVRVQSFKRLVWAGESASKGPHSTAKLVLLAGRKPKFLAMWTYHRTLECLHNMVAGSPGVSDLRERASQEDAAMPLLSLC